MDQPKYTTLVAALTALLDPRKALGKRYAWMFLLTLIVIVLTSSQRTLHAIADWNCLAVGRLANRTPTRLANMSK
jgi:hypothetical protein